VSSAQPPVAEVPQFANYRLGHPCDNHIAPRRSGKDRDFITTAWNVVERIIGQKLAAGVDNRLWEIKDIVDMIAAYEKSN
jgi:hypothetical protein